MWFRDPEKAWSTPTQLETRWKGLYGGIEPEAQVFPLEAYVRGPMHSTDAGKIKSWT